MPHQCTTCGQAFPDGSKEMLSGCPDCGGNKFQFLPGELPDASADDGPTSQSSGSGSPSTGSGSPAAGSGSPSPTPETASNPGGDRSHVASAVEKAADTLRDFVAERARPSTPTGPADGGPAATGSSTGSREADAADARPETTQATLDAVARDAPTGEEATDEIPWDDRPDDGDVASRWPSVGTEAGVETGDRDEAADGRSEADGDRGEAAGHHEWPDPWAPDDDGDDFIIAPSSEADVAVEGGDEDPASAGRDADPATPGHDAETIAAGTSAEDRAQADARTSMVETGDLPERTASGRVVDEPTGERPDLAQLREELNDQFESIRVVAPGQYELNLMELYDREEYIIAIQENGKYVIEVPDVPEIEEA